MKKISVLALAAVLFTPYLADAQTRAARGSTVRTQRNRMAAEPVYVPPPVKADDAEDVNAALIREVKGRYSFSYAKALNFCGGLESRINSVKVAAGISTGTSVGTTLGGGAALASGLVKDKYDKEAAAASQKIKDASAYADKFAAMSDDQKLASIMSGELQIALDVLRDAQEELEAAQQTAIADGQAKLDSDTKSKIASAEKEKTVAEKSAATAGKVRTASAFVAGGASLVSGISSFAGVSSLDGLIKDMNACDSYVREIKEERDELAALKSDDKLIRSMDDITAACSGFNGRNIETVKGKMIATGVISTTGAVAGAASGVTSMVGNKATAEGDTAAAANNKNMNIASNILAGTTAAAGLTSVIISGTALADLNKNAKIAADCRNAF